ncbi:hypothetical protein [Zavarzinella formosa]|uniref:hypothetical protein n=1 Tax=Zavarzinella formosa TaxID=360055 RepID=UPI0003609D6C|nr:hypothetical protein [Zavarzinella formosa]
MATSKFLENLRETTKPKDEDTRPEDDDSIESLAGDGRDSRHQVLAVQLVQQSRDSRAVLYGSIIGTIDYNPSKGVHWHFEGKNGLERVDIAGRLLDRIYDKLTCGKRETIKVNGDSVTSIAFSKVEEAE